MQFQKSTISITLAIAATASLASPAHASTKYDVILQQLGFKPTPTQIAGPQTTQAQTVQPQLQKRIAMGQAGQTSFSHPLTLVRVASSQLGVSIPSTYEFTLTVPQDAGQPLKAVTIT